MIDGQILNEVWRCKPQVYSHAAAAIRLKPQTAPAQYTGAGWAEQYLERGFVPAGAGVGGGLASDRDTFSFLIIGPQSAVAPAERAVARGDRAGITFERPACFAAMT